MPKPPRCRRQARARRLEKQTRHRWRHSYTPEQSAVRTFRDIRRRYCSCGTTARHHYAHWLNELMREAQAGRPYGKEFTRRLLLAAQLAHRNSLRATPTTYPPALA